MKKLLGQGNKNQLTNPGRQIAKMQILLMCIVVLLAVVITYFSMGLSYAKSALAGGVIGIIPNIVFAYKAFKYAGAQASRKVLESFFSGEKLKMVLTAILLAFAFKLMKIEPIAFFTTFCLVMATPLLTPIFLGRWLKK